MGVHLKQDAEKLGASIQGNGIPPTGAVLLVEKAYHIDPINEPARPSSQMPSTTIKTFPSGFGRSAVSGLEVTGAGFGLLEVLILADLYNILGKYERAIDGRQKQAYRDMRGDDREFDCESADVACVVDAIDDTDTGYYEREMNACEAAEAEGRVFFIIGGASGAHDEHSQPPARGGARDERRGRGVERYEEEDESGDGPRSYLKRTLTPTPHPPRTAPPPLRLCRGDLPLLPSVSLSLTGLVREHDLPVAWPEVTLAAQVHFPSAHTGVNIGGQGQGQSARMVHEVCVRALQPGRQDIGSPPQRLNISELEACTDDHGVARELQTRAGAAPISTLRVEFRRRERVKSRQATRTCTAYEICWCYK
ncbi:hypothetical protein B0H11DRAFT_1923294 [Mycena galericulata]|nr:hypothetical protein B0H11DRAFT_1923294 [Mycena galericulata]